jgi:transcription initiation factor TFIID subunit 5
MPPYYGATAAMATPKILKSNLDVQVIEYLVKKGYNRTEQMLRQESSNLDKDGKPIPERVEDLGTQKYTKAFQLLSNWVDSNLDIYKVNNRHYSCSVVRC